MNRYTDLAIPIAWPDQTARGDEAWMALLKRIGLVKNLNFRVGHAAIIILNRSSGEIRYYDFGRYITPRGYGRARSASSDPRLTLYTKAKFDAPDGKLSNFEEILEELTSKDAATHGGGRLVCSHCYDISFERARAFGEKLVDQGPILYGALAKNNNSCSRYVAQILVEAMPQNDPRAKAILYPEFIKASPTSNVVNAATNYTIYCYNGQTKVLETWNMNRSKSLRFQLGLLRDNFSASGARRLPDDSQPGSIAEPARAIQIPPGSQWLGGIGEGKWFSLQYKNDEYFIERYDPDGSLEYRVPCTPDSNFDRSKAFKFTFDVHHSKHVVEQGANKITFKTINCDSKINAVDYHTYASKTLS
jgi:hypothetical protein